MKVVRWEIWWQMAWWDHAITKNKNKIKGAEGGRRTAGRKLDGSSSAVGSIKNTTEEVTETDDERKCNGGRGSWRKGNGRGLECPLTSPMQWNVSKQTKLAFGVKVNLLFLLICKVTDRIYSLHWREWMPRDNATHVPGFVAPVMRHCDLLYFISCCSRWFLTAHGLVYR